MWLVCLFVLQHAHEKPKLQENKAVSTISMKANAGPGNIGILEQCSVSILTITCITKSKLFLLPVQIKSIEIACLLSITYFARMFSKNVYHCGRII